MPPLQSTTAMAEARISAIANLTRKDKMTNLRRLVSTFLLVLSMAVIGWADGGETQGGNGPTPPPPATQGATDCTTSETTLLQPDASVTTDDVANVLVIWL